MPDTTSTQNVQESIHGLYAKQVQAMHGVQMEAYKQYNTAYCKFLEALGGIFRDDRSQTATRNYVEGLHAAWARQDAQRYSEASRHYLNEAYESQLGARKRLEDAYRSFIEEVRQIATASRDSQRGTFGDFMKDLQDTLSKIDIKGADAAVVAKVAEAMIAAAYLRAFQV